MEDAKMEGVTKFLTDAPIVKNEPITAAVWQMVLEAPAIAAAAQPGQFIGVASPDRSMILRRPLGIADADRERGTITLIYRLAGQGTQLLANPDLRHVSVEGPLGKGFPLRAGKGLLIGGGVGLAPLIFLARSLDHPAVLIGGKSRQEMFWKPFFAPYTAEIYETTDDGSVGEKGFTTQAMPKILADHAFDFVATCGPMIMMKGIAAICKQHHLTCDVSMEKRMACGIGVCLGCTFEGKKSGRRLKVCADGPVFAAEEVFG